MTSGVLSSALPALTAAASVGQVLEPLTAHVLAGLAEWCIVDLLEPPDLVTRHVAATVDGPMVLPAGSGQVGARRSSADTAGLLSQLAQTPSRPLRRSAAELAAMTASGDGRLQQQAALALSLQVQDLLLLALRGGDQLLGVLVVGRSARSFTDDEVEDLVDLAALTGLALERLRLLEVQRGVVAALQRTLLPRLPVLDGLTVAARFVPATETLAVGGDWYDSVALPDGDVAVVVGDATGHDLGAAVRMAELRNLLRALVVDRRGTPAETLTRLDHVLHQVAPALSGTCLLAHVAAGRLLRWSSAGHLPPVLLRDGAARLLEHADPDLMLGVDAATVRSDAELQLQPGDVLLLYTDGLVEHRSVGLDERLQLLARRVQEVGAASVEDLADRLVEELASGEDDVALLVVRVDA